MKLRHVVFAIATFLLLASTYYLIEQQGLENARNYSVIFGVLIAIIVYVTNSYYQYKQRISDNALRYIEVHKNLFNNEFLLRNIPAMEKAEKERSAFVRDLNDAESEKNFNRLLGNIEDLALLSKHGVVSKSANIYMFGWFARHIQSVLTIEERNNVYWELAVKFLDELKQDADDFYNLSKDTRAKYFKKNHFFH